MPHSSSPGKRGVKIIHLSTSDWDYSCAGMTCEEEGVFFRIIRLMYRQGGPIRDDDRLHRALRLDPRAWKRLRGSLANLGVLEWIGGMIVQKRVQEELASVSEKRAKASEAGTVGNQKRWGTAVDKAVDDFGLQPSLPFDEPQVEGDCADKETALRSEIFDNPLKNNKPVIATPSPTPINIKKGREALSKGEGEKVPEAGSLAVSGVKFESGQIVLDDAHRAFWLPRFGNDPNDLAMGLMQAAAWIDDIDRLSPEALALQVDGQLALQIRARSKTTRTPNSQTAGQRAALDADRRMRDAVHRVLAAKRQPTSVQ